MHVRSSWPFLGALLSAGVFGVHQLRYGLAYGEEAGSALTASGHGYLVVVEPLVGLALAFAFAHALWRIAGGVRRHATSRRHVAVVFALTILVLYTTQELLEGELAAGHAGGLAGVFGSGGWIAVPLAFLLGGLLSLAVRVVDSAAEAVASRTAVSVPRPAAGATPSLVGSRQFSFSASPLTRHLAGRGPPQFLSS